MAFDARGTSKQLDDQTQPPATTTSKATLLD